MKRKGVFAFLVAAFLAAGPSLRAATPPGDRVQGDDDLAVVKRAVMQSKETPRAGALGPSAVRKGDKPLWLRVRIVEKGNRKRVSVNVPLALVRALGDWPIEWRCRRDDDNDRRCKIRVSEVLDALDAGQSLVEVDDEDATVRIWVE